MEDIVINSILGVTALLAIVSCFVIVYLKMYYHYKYIKLIRGSGDGSDFLSDMPVIIAPIIIRNKEQERSNKELAQIGIRIKKLLIIFFSLFFYFLLITQLI